MKASKFLSLFILIGLFSTGLIFANADALEYSNYYEENVVCTIFTTTAQPIVVTDGTDYEFEDGHKYLIIATTSWTGEDNSLTYEINMQHNATIFEGSQDIIEPKHSADSCDSDKKWYKYWHWVIWNPIGSQADEDISLNMVSNDNTIMIHDDSTIFILDISERMIENFDWFYDEVTIDEPLDDVGWNTNSSATLSFTPTSDDNEWLILGTATLSVDDVADQFETRLNFENGTQITPYISKEGEDTEDQYVQSFSRVFTLNNTQAHDFKVESRTDEISVGNNIRTYNSLFALNLNIFSSHNATYGGDGLFLLPEQVVVEYETEIMTLDIQDDETQDWYIFSSFTKESDKDAYFRVQVDNVDQPADQTTTQKQLSDNWDSSDFGMNGFGTFENLDNSIHTVDVDGSIKEGAGDRDRDIGSRSLWAFTMESAPRVFDDITWNDNSTMTFSIFQNATDTVSWSDSVDGESPLLTNQTITDTVTWSDFTNATFSISQEITDTITWNDNSTMIIDLVTDATDTVTWEDTTEMVVAFGVEETDTVSWSDEVTIVASYFSDVLDGTITWDDFIDILIDVSQDVTDTVTWDDETEMTFDVSQVAPTDTVTWEDETIINFDVSQVAPTDTVTWSDEVLITTMYFSDVLDGEITWNDDIVMEVAFDMDADDTVTWSDSVTGFIDASGEVSDTITWEDEVLVLAELFQEIIDVVTWEDEPEMTFDISQVVPTDTVSWEDDVSMVVAFDMDIDDIVTWSDTNTATITAFAVVGDSIGWQDASGYGFDPFDQPFPIIPPHPPIAPSPPTTPSGGIVPTIPDSDGDGFPDNVDGCPFDPENFNDFEDDDGCPDRIPLVVIPTIPDTGFLPFELTQFDVVDDNIILEEQSVRPQVEDLTVRWLGDSPITITSIEVADSPFEFQFDNIPRIIGTSDLGITESQIEYTIQAPRQICTNDFSFDCVSNVTYDIPIIITGEVDGKIVITEGRIRVDNSDRTNPYSLILASLVLIPILAIIVWKKGRKKTKLKVIGGDRSIAHGRSSVDYQDTKGENKFRFRGRKEPREKLSLIRPRDNKSGKTTSTNFRILNPKKREEKRFTFRNPDKDKKKKKRNFLGR